MAKTINAGYTDAQSVNESSLTTYIYRDFSLFFTKNPVTGDISTLTDVADVKRSVRNLVLTNEFDRPFHPEIASGVRESLFENFTPVTIANIRTRIQSVLTQFEPRVTVTAIVVNDPDNFHIDNNTLNLQIHFTLNNAPNTEQQVDVMLERVR